MSQLALAASEPDVLREDTLYRAPNSTWFSS